MPLAVGEDFEAGRVPTSFSPFLVLAAGAQRRGRGESTATRAIVPADSIPRFRSSARSRRRPSRPPPAPAARPVDDRSGTFRLGRLLEEEHVLLRVVGQGGLTLLSPIQRLNNASSGTCQGSRGRSRCKGHPASAIASSAGTMLADLVEDHVVRPAAPRKVFAEVVDDLVGAERPPGSGFRGAYGGRLRPKPLRGCTAAVPIEPGAAKTRMLRPSRGAPPSVGSRAQAPLRRRPRRLLEGQTLRHTRESGSFARRPALPSLQSVTPKTRSPTRNSPTAAPTSSISPASSMPRILRLGRRSR